ncbi:hypothetical protein IMG5_101180 [Ichthyophthirius multifiliis]|uniref:Uncharacterized protein n=1 Tax=Ichthyophthirius multifiliis TaxID=5932 RepID=G0QSH7_ICHMU|nr:hypothetical protein IMG5_101180 [Ichthyophthirius multifiliis]EGR31815.1 hypothetical protein IMG5_101180 [Ichthyophthirius multifiliis]|eukprot:XP_004035301.1 hypothetical protein IMG5_101180 [Ichthyophthirius multifiliis]
MNIKSFDMYRKLPSDLTQSTTSGAVVSIICGIIVLILFISELRSFLAIEETSEMFIDIVRGGQKIKVNLDIDFPKFPCDILSLDMQDIMGSHTVNIEGTINKRRISSDGNYFDLLKAGADDSEFNLQRATQAYMDKEGCNISGTMLVNKVPGNFHISSHAYGHVLGQVLSNAGKNTIDLSHKVKHLSFGDEFDLKNIKRQFSQGLLHPMDNKQKDKPQNILNGITYQYYINIVPTTYVDTGNKNYHVYQFTYNSNEQINNHLPTVYYRYDLSPVTVKFSMQKESFLHFLVQICAIIGGIFTVASIVDSIVYRAVLNILKRDASGTIA